MRNVQDKGGTAKLRSYWEPTIFEVVRKHEEIPIFEIRNLSKKSDKRIVHRNLLMKNNDLSLELFHGDGVTEKKGKKSEVKQNRSECHESTDEDYDVLITQYVHPVSDGGREEVISDDDDSNTAADVDNGVMPEENNDVMDNLDVTEESTASEENEENSITSAENGDDVIDNSDLGNEPIANEENVNDPEMSEEFRGRNLFRVLEFK